MVRFSFNFGKYFEFNYQEKLKEGSNKKFFKLTILQINISSGSIFTTALISFSKRGEKNERAISLYQR